MANADEPATPDRLRAAVERRRTGSGLEPTTSGLMRALALVGRDALDLDVAVVVTTSAGDLVRAVGADDRSEALARIEQTSGEGPVRTAVRDVRVVSAADLGHDGVPWPGYADGASARDIAAVHAVPLVVGPVVLGALQLSSARSVGLDGDRHLTALALAQIATELLLEELGSRGPDALLQDGTVTSMEVHQAQGMVMAALGVSLDEALARMRAHAFARDTDLTDLARDIVARRVRIDDD